MIIFHCVAIYSRLKSCALQKDQNCLCLSQQCSEIHKPEGFSFSFLRAEIDHSAFVNCASCSSWERVPDFEVIVDIFDL